MSSCAPILPNFFLAGAPKAGTTSLYHYLRQHPAIFMSDVKEPSFFAAEVRPENFAGPHRDPNLITDWWHYLALFREAAGAAAIGEASVCYLWSPTAPRAIADRIPCARILAMLRDPAERAWSQYLHGVADGRIHGTLRQHIQDSLRDTAGVLRTTYPFLQFGHYAAQLRRWYALFPANQIRVFLYDDYLRGPQSIFRDIFEFVGVDPGFTPDTERCYHLFPERTQYPLDIADRRFLIDHYHEDILALSSLLDRDLAAWLR